MCLNLKERRVNKCGCFCKNTYSNKTLGEPSIVKSGRLNILRQYAHCSSDKALVVVHHHACETAARAKSQSEPEQNLARC